MTEKFRIRKSVAAVALFAIAGVVSFSSVFAAAAEPQVTPVNKYVAPALSDPNNWTMVVVPDTQSYVKKSCNQGVLELMFAWIAKNCEPLKIQQVLVTGDLVDQNRRHKINIQENKDMIDDHLEIRRS